MEHEFTDSKFIGNLKADIYNKLIFLQISYDVNAFEFINEFLYIELNSESAKFL